MDLPIAKIRRVNLDRPFVLQRIDEIESQYSVQDRLPHRHDYYVILLIREASGIHQIDFVDYPIENNSLHFLSPDQIHHFKPEGLTNGFALTFTADFLNQYITPHDQLISLDLFFNCNEAAPFTVASEEAEALSVFLKVVENEMETGRDCHLEVIGACVKAFLFLAKRSKSHLIPKHLIQQTRQNEIVFQFRKELEANFRNQHKVGEFADQLHLTSNYLNEVVKKQTGHSAKEMIQTRILLEAKRLAVYSTMSMKEIAWHLGFEDIAHFSKFFKRLNGTNFKAFRAQKP